MSGQIQTQVAITFGENQAGAPIMQITQAAVLDPLPLLRQLKKRFPAAYTQVAMEIIVPDKAPVNRINGHVEH